MVHPLDVRVQWWDALTMGALVFTAVVTPVEVAFMEVGASACIARFVSDDCVCDKGVCVVSTFLLRHSGCWRRPAARRRPTPTVPLCLRARLGRNKGSHSCCCKVRYDALFWVNRSIDAIFVLDMVLQASRPRAHGVV